MVRWWAGEMVGRHALQNCGMSVSRITANLIPEPAGCQPARLYTGPTQLRHDRRQSAAGSGRAGALRHLQEIEQCLRAYSLDAVVAGLALYALQAEAPRILAAVGQVILRLPQLLDECHVEVPQRCVSCFVRITSS